MKDKRIIDKRRVKLDEIMRADHIPFLGGRPRRTVVISGDDILNLRIILNTSVDVLDVIDNL